MEVICHINANKVFFPQCKWEGRFSLLFKKYLLNWPLYAEDVDLVPGSGRSPGGGQGNPLQYSCLGNPMDRGAWRVTVHGVAKGWTQLRDWAVSLFLSLHRTSCRSELFMARILSYKSVMVFLSATCSTPGLTSAAAQPLHASFLT